MLDDRAPNHRSQRTGWRGCGAGRGYGAVALGHRPESFIYERSGWGFERRGSGSQVRPSHAPHQSLWIWGKGHWVIGIQATGLSCAVADLGNGALGHRGSWLDDEAAGRGSRGEKGSLAEGWAVVEADGHSAGGSPDAGEGVGVFGGDEVSHDSQCDAHEWRRSHADRASLGKESGDGEEAR